MGKQESAISLKEITADTCWNFFNLEVEESQSQYVAPNAHSIAEASFTDEAWFRGIYAGEEPVGFVMLYLDSKKPEYFVWRLMIDKKHQHNGYGFQAMQQIIEHVRGLPKAEELLVSYVPGEGSPAKFYYKLGFEETGQVLEGENVLKLAL